MGNTIPFNISSSHPKIITKDRVQGLLLELLGLEEVTQPVNFTKELMEETEDGLCLFKVTYFNDLGEVVPGIVSMPVDAKNGSLAGVVCLPGTGGSADQVAHPYFHREHCDSGPLIGWGRELARRGFVTLSITLKGCEIRRGSLERWQETNNLLAPYGRSLMGVQVKEALLGARLLASFDYVDPERIGLTGMSLGGNVTWYAMACDPWIRAAVPICGGLGSLARVIHGDRVTLDRHSAYFFIPHLLRYFDHPEVVAACIPPRPFLMVSPTQDEDMPRSGVDELISVVASVYESIGYPECFQVRQPEGNHGFQKKYFEWMVEWFQHFLHKGYCIGGGRDFKNILEG